MKKQKQTPWPAIALQILAIIGCGSGAITLTGCTVECSLYDEICCPDSDRGCDLDHDEYTTRQGDADCDDDPEINPGVPEVCDGVDNNCDGVVDEDVQVPFYPDSDGDGYYGTADGIPLFFCAGTLVEAYATTEGDCNDTNSSIYPTAVEVCDGIDQDCDHQIDETLTFSTYYLDQDADGFGLDDDAAAFTDCRQPEGYSGNNDDCNDLEPSIYPGAPELCDGRDNDCDGQADTEDSRHYFRDQDGDGFGVLEDAEDPTSVACAESLEYVPARGDCNDADSSIHPGADDPASDGIDKDCGLHDGPDAHVGFVTSDYGTLQDALTGAADGTRVWIGPGTYLEHDLSWTGKTLELWSTELAEATVIDAGGAGGGLVLYSLPEINVVDGVTVTGASSGAAIWIESTAIEVCNCIVTENTITGMYIESANVVVNNCNISKNKSSVNSSGLEIINSTVILQRTQITENISTSNLSSTFNIDPSSTSANPPSSDIFLENCIISSNVSHDYYSVADIRAESFTMQFCTIVGNSAMIAAIVLKEVSNLSFTNNIVANNAGGNIRVYEETYADDIQENLLYSPIGRNIWSGSVASSNSVNAPQFIRFMDDRKVKKDDLHLNPNSPAWSEIDAGSQWGVYGGISGNRNYYRDSDRDSMYDGWEINNELDITVDDSNTDSDGDTLINVNEFYANTLPKIQDTDGDSFLDSDEVITEADPLDWYSVPNQADFRSAIIPLDFPTIQEAIDAMRSAGTIYLERGEYPESLQIDNRNISLIGINGAAQTLIVGASDSDKATVSIYGSLQSNLRGLTISGGRGLHGGGLSLCLASSSSFSNLVISGNSSREDGGGVLFVVSDGIFSRCLVTNNSAEGYGGGMNLDESSVVVENSIIADNSTKTWGGGLRLGAIWDYTGGEIRNCIIARNRASDFTDSDGGRGGAMYLSASGPLLDHLTIVRNEAPVAGGLWFDGYGYPSDSSQVTNSIIAYNSNFNAYDVDSLRSPLFTHSVLYNPEGYANYNIPDEDLDDTNLFVEPGFLTYTDAEGNACTPGSSLECLPTDFHLALDSLLIDTGDPEELDPDGTISDIGAYGGIDADAWDLDGDGYSDYFWPGTITDAPEGFDPADYDCDDLDPEIGSCF